MLLRILAGLLEPTAGRVTWAGSLPDRRRAPRIGFVFQRPVLLRRSALANIEYALAVAGVGRAERSQRALAALKPGAPVVIAAPVPAQRPVPAITGWSTTTTAAAPTPPGLAPPEGRMALAGPAAETPPVPSAPLPGVVPPAPEKRVSRPTSGFKSEGNWARNIFKNNWN